MKIHAKQVAPDVYSVSFGETDVILEGSDVKVLLMELMQILTPGEGGAGSVISKEEQRRLDFLEHIKGANNVGIQKLLLVADHHDLLTLLKSAEDDADMHERFFSNMSDNNAKMFDEDLSFEFREGLSDKRRREGLDRLIKLTRELELDGDLVFEKPKNK